MRFARPLAMLGTVCALLVPALMPGQAGAASPPVRSAVGSRDDADLIATLIRSNLIALHQANTTGNYSVLRDLGSESFRDQFNAAELAAIFKPLRDRMIDLQAVAILQPAISDQPILDENNIMRVAGTFPTRPTPIKFEFAFQVENKVWKVVGLSVDPIEAMADLGVTRKLGYAVPTPRP